MLDTVKFALDAQLRGLSRGVRPHPLVRFRRGALEGRIGSVECESLPKLLWGHNGRVIATQAELDAALGQLWTEVNRVVEAPQLGEWRPLRLDLVWQFAGLGSERVI